MRKLLLLVVGVLTITAQLLAQSRTVTGIINDENGQAIFGASVTIKGSRIGTTTDQKGAFTLNVPASSSTLVISAVGYAETELAIADKTTFTVSLKPSGQDMSEVV